ncbi:hypothetical protein BVG19_g2014 [[Candida] boidinii]|nr:hypothetical protein BVG19_g2014 [[Candida] boidinii]OWB49385.1 hypothetical protein B5S27_g926 [[Candida] boidinii]OWB64988.1 hypothetical protein B5S30_g310 [[Candida] boidinii]OWB82869.1 hypothetical protein B5S33_g1497 [[Candida] boidinii]GMF99953.1 unnamed protein product [[Candida] boidinii]
MSDSINPASSIPETTAPAQVEESKDVEMKDTDTKSAAEDTTVTEPVEKSEVASTEDATTAAASTEAAPTEATTTEASETKKSEDSATAVTESTETKTAEENNTEEGVQIINLQQRRKELEDEAKQYLAKQTRPVIIPSFASWFDMNTIHEIEKRSLPEFFNNPESRYKKPEVYKEFRDFMINTYRLNPIEYLTVTAVRRNLAGDVASIMRVHGFLCKWGLINYQVDPRTKPFLTGPQYTGHFQITLDTPEGLAPLIPKNAKIVDETSSGITTNNKETKIKSEESNIISTKLPLNLELRHNVYDSTQDAFTLRNEDREKFNNTLVGLKQLYSSVTGNDITETRYHNLRSKSNISSKDFEEGHFPSNFKNSDFVKLDKIVANSEFKPWSDQEILLLLEAIEMYDDDWNTICGHVGSRTKEQCISKFIQLPIEDTYLEQIIPKSQFKKLQNLKKSTVNGVNKIEQDDDEEEEGYDTTNKINTVNQLIDLIISKVDGNQVKKTISEELGDEDILKGLKYSIGSISGSAKLESDNIISEEKNLLRELVELELNKIDIKMKRLTIVEKTLELEKKEVSRQKHDLITDRLSLRKQANLVQSKLLKAAELGATDEGLQLCEEAVIEANKAPRIVNTRKLNKMDGERDNDSTSGGDGDESNSNLPNGDKKGKVIGENSFEPLSVQTPQVFKVWSA